MPIPSRRDLSGSCRRSAADEGLVEALTPPTNESTTVVSCGYESKLLFAKCIAEGVGTRDQRAVRADLTRSSPERAPRHPHENQPFITSLRRNPKVTR
ncbi:hypothetical protein CDAR_103321 [Caerostris darwini]|uniref:Uncharacterized protein n=1 Tax=Caerostris darwini TaxID=1538125 RepID=A0AAV4V3I9_9ARAC|nr:hypothetical protein CDAR_103321 [Caerostris darwini]